MQTTPNYGLKKPDGTDAVDISKLNENFDTIDTQLKANADAISTNATAIENISLVDTAINVTDEDNHFTADSNNKKTLDNILSQLFQFANNGKNSIANAIGSPLVNSDTFTQMTTKIDTLKSTLASNLVAKGQTASSTDTLSNLVGKVADIDNGLKVLNGGNASIKHSAGGPDSGLNYIEYTLNFSASFTPQTIYIYIPRKIHFKGHYYSSYNGEDLIDDMCAQPGYYSNNYDTKWGLGLGDCTLSISLYSTYCKIRFTHLQSSWRPYTADISNIPQLDILKWQLYGK